MAAADYYLCDTCGRKTFHDSSVDYGDPGVFVGEMAVICPECAKRHTITIVRDDPKKMAMGKAVK